jgi:hypothetical protein
VTTTTTAAGATTAPAAGPTGRLAALLAAIRQQGGEWTTKRALACYRQARLTPVDMRHAHLRSVARGDLRDLCAWGWLIQHDEPNHLHYTLNTRRGDAR